MRTLLACLLLATSAPLAVSAPNAPAGKPATPAANGAAIAREGNARGATPCSVCHGMDGSGRVEAGIPRLAGQEASYLAKQLLDFQQGARSHFAMGPVARTLDTAEIHAVVGYYAGLPARETKPSPAPTEVLALGAWMADRGIVEKGVPACNSCHGPDGSGLGPLYPRLAGQSAPYMRSQLEHLRTGERSNDPAGMMRTIASLLSPSEARAVAAYYESLGRQAAVEPR